MQARNQSHVLDRNINYRNYNEVYLLSEEGSGKGSSVSCVGSQIRVFPGIYREKSWSNWKLGRCFVVFFWKLNDLEIFLHIDFKRQQVIDFAINHLCNRENSPVKLFFCFSGKLKYLALSDQVLVYSNSIWVMGNDRKQKIGRLLSCIGERSSLDLFRGQDIFINVL